MVKVQEVYLSLLNFHAGSGVGLAGALYQHLPVADNLAHSGGGGSVIVRHHGNKARVVRIAVRPACKEMLPVSGRCRDAHLLPCVATHQVGLAALSRIDRQGAIR